MTSTDRINGVNASTAIKAPCIAVTTANITLSGTQTINGVAVVADDRVLVKDQTTASENGIWIVSSTAWSRAPDFDGNRDAVKGTIVPVIIGSTLSLYTLTTANPIVIGTTSLVFAVAAPLSATALILSLMDDATAAEALTTLGAYAAMQNQTSVAYTTGGTSSAYTLTPTPAISAYAENQEFDVEFHTASTGTPTINISAVGAKSLKYRGPTGTLVTCGTLIPSGWRSKVTYDGTDLIVREMPQSAYNSASTPAAGTAAGTAGSAGTHSDSAHAHPPMSGNVIKVAYAGLTTYTTSTTVMAEGGAPPTNTEGEEKLTLAFTPKLATSTLRIRVRGSVIVLGSYRCCAALFVDSTANALAAHVGTNAPIDIEYYVSAASTSARTYKLRIGPSSAGTIAINGNFGGSIGGLTMSVDEIAA